MRNNPDVFQKLKSGSDVRGIAIGEQSILTVDVVKRLGAAFALFLSNKYGLDLVDVSIAIGRDSRLSGPSLLSAACEGIAGTGANAYDCGMCTTPSMYMAILEPEFAPTGSIMITASHHPWQINGMKFFTKDGGLGYSELDSILNTARENKIPSSLKAGLINQYPYIPLYQKHLETLIRNGLPTEGEKPLQGLHVVVDAGNGAGGFYAEMLSSLGACIDGSQFLEPDGQFPNHPPNPENEEAMQSLSDAIIHSGADIGVIFDADCDRAAIVDSTGREINRNRLIALISAILLKKYPGSTIVTDSVTSTGLEAFIRAHGGKQYRYKRGYRNVIDEAIRLNQIGIDCPLAIETSGHAAMRENMFLDDGMYLVTYLIIRAMLLKRQGLLLSTLIEDLEEPIESAEYRMKILDTDFRKAGETLIHTIKQLVEKCTDCKVAPDNREGVRISFDLQGGKDNGWLLLRLSVHDPVMPLNVESDVIGGKETMIRVLYQMLEPFSSIDTSPLKNNL